MKILVIVESPNKIKKINQILSNMKDGNTYIVSATAGHIMDLKKEGKNIGINIDNNYEPEYVENKDKKSQIISLRKSKKECDKVVIASDLDQEGEFIGYSICQILKLNIKNTDRIIFNEITSKCIENAIKSPKRLNDDILNGQKCRRVMDRLIGFKISPAAASVHEGLSVGRVQTMMVKMVIDRENEMNSHDKLLYYQTDGEFQISEKLKNINGHLNTKLKVKDNVMKFIEECTDATFTINKPIKKTVSKKPPAPLITTSLQSLVSHRLGISPKQVLDVAQQLYEHAVISYPRTDCPEIPIETMDKCKDYIMTTYGEKYYQERQYKSKDSSAQEAHKCIYPTNIYMNELTDQSDQKWTETQKKVYNYIWLYAMSSQMSDSKTDNYKCIIDISTREEKFISEYNKLIFEGYLKIWGTDIADVDMDMDNISNDTNTSNTKNDNLYLMSITKNQIVEPIKITSQQKYENGPTPYTESTLVTQLKKYGIGRPSTYGAILEKVSEHNYKYNKKGNSNKNESKGFIKKDDIKGKKVRLEIITWDVEKEEIVEDTKEIMLGSYKKRLISTNLGRALIEFTDEHFSNVFNYKFTKELQDEMKDIEEGNKIWYEVVDKLYKSFSSKLSSFSRWSKKGDGKHNKDKRHIGELNDKPVLVYLAKFGPVIQIGEDTDDETMTKPKYISLPDTYNIKNVKYEDIKHLLLLPYLVGEIDDKELYVKKGKFGLYLNDGANNYQIKEDMFSEYDKEDDMERQINKIDIELVKKSLNNTKEAKDKNLLREVDGLKIMDGQYGPYFKYNDKFVSIPKNKDIDNLTKDELIQCYKNKIEYKKNGFSGRGNGRGRGTRGKK